MQASSDCIVDVEMSEAAPLSKGGGTDASPPAHHDADMPLCEQDAVPGADICASEHPTTQSITVHTEPPESAVGVTAYFLFSNVHREQVKAALQAAQPESGKVSIGMIGKKIGELWRQCPDEVKQAYSDKAKTNKEQTKKDAAPDGGAGEGVMSKAAPMSLPASVVKKIVMLDEDQSRIAADAVKVLTKASEMFLSVLAAKSHDEAKGAARNSVNFRDIESVLRRWKPTAWQSSPFGEIEKSAVAVPVQNKGMTEAAQKTRSITSFFQQAS